MDMPPVFVFILSQHTANVKKKPLKSGTSLSVEPSVKDHWAIFQLYGKIFDHCPSADELIGVPWADPYKKWRRYPCCDQNAPRNGLFLCESSMYYFRKRKYVLIGKDRSDVPCIPDGRGDMTMLILGCNHSGGNSDTDLIYAIVD